MFILELLGTFALRGVAQDTDGGFRFLFYPVAARRSSQTNNTFVASEYTINEKSTLSISGSHTLRTYEEDPLFQGRVSDQSRVSAGIMYTRKYSEQSSWGIGYGWAHYGFKQFENGRSHGVNIEYSHQFDRSLTLQATVGPSHTEIESRGSYFSYNASLGLQKRIKSNSFSFSYHRSGGESSGYSSVSKTQQLRIGAARQLTKKMTASMEFSWFDSQAQAVSSYQTLGSAASAGMGWALNRTLSLNWGTEFQRYGGGSDTAFEQKRLFFSLRFDNPMLFRLSR